VASVVAALGFLYYFQPPVRSFRGRPAIVRRGGGFLITAIIVSQTALKARRQRAEALERKRETERLYELGQAMLASENLETTVYLAINQTIRIFGVSGTAFHVRSSGAIHRAGESGAIGDEALRAVTAGRTDRTDPSQRLAMVPIRMGEEVAGSFGLCGGAISDTVLRSIASLLSVVLERGQAADKLVLANRELEQRHGRWNNRSRFPNRCC
jgi:K+-sensing histidine kinase KdpD